MFAPIFLLVVAASAPDDFSMILPMSPETAEGQRRIAARALEICGGRYPQLGRYRFSGTEALTGDRTGESRFEIQQELTCLDAPPPAQPRGATSAPSDWQPGPEDERQVLALTRRYFSLVDAGEAAPVHALWSQGNQETTPLAERAAELEEFRRNAGAPGEHRIAALTWYVNPEGAPRPGIYVAADYERAYSRLEFNCGYVVWFREGEGRYVLIREETSSFPRGTDASPTVIEEARRQLRCPQP